MALPSSNLYQNILPMDWDEEYSSNMLPMDWDEELSSNVLPMDWDEKPEEPGWVETITEAVTEDVPASFKVSGGGLMQQLATPGGLASTYPGLMQAPSLLLDIAKEKWGKPIVDAGKELATTGRKEQQEGISPYTTGSPKYYTRKIVSGAAEMLPSIAAGIITRNPNLSLAMMGTHAGASKYDQSIREGRSHDQATTDGIFFGLSEALTEKIPLGILMKRGGGYFVNIGKAGAAEAIQEPVNELIQQLYDTAVLDKEMTFDEVVHNMGEAAKIGGGVGALLSAITGLFIRRGGSLVDLDDTTLETKPGELDLDETQPIVGPPGPAATVTGPPSPITPVDLELAEEGAPVVEAVDVPTTSTPIETRLDAIEEPIIDAPVVDEAVIDEEVPRRELGDADPISQPGFYNKFQDMISRIVLGDKAPREEYRGLIEQVATSLNENPETFFENNKESALLSEGEQDQSLIIADDGARLPVSEIVTSEGKPVRSTRIDVVAALRRGNEIFDENFEKFIYEIQRYHQSYGTGRPPLKIVIDLGGGGMEASAYYNSARHELVVNVAHLMSGIEGAPQKDLSSTAIHELVHMKVWTLFQDKALQVLQKSRDGETITPDMIDEETHSLVDNFGRKLVKPLRKEIKEFLNARWTDAKNDNENPARRIARSLNLKKDTDLFNSIANAKDTNEIFNILSKSMESGERLTHTGTEGIINLPVGIGYHVIHELLAYHGMTLDTLLDPGSIPTPKQKTFIQKILRLAKQILGQVLGDKQLTKEDVSDFINVMFLETAGAMDKGATEQTKLYRAAQEQAQPTPLSGESYDVKPPISRMVDKEDEKIDISRRKFLKQTAGAAAGAVVDPTILAEPAAAAATVGKKAAWAGMSAIDTVYRFAESIMVQDEAREEGFEGEIIYDIVYDSSKPNELEVNVTIGQDDVETYVLDDISGEEGLEPGEYVILEMHDIDKIVSDMITTGRDPSGAETEWNIRNVYGVQPPHRNPFGEQLADENRVIDEQDLEAYSGADKKYLEDVSGEEVKVIDSVDPKTLPPLETRIPSPLHKRGLSRDNVTGELRKQPELLTTRKQRMESTPAAEPAQTTEPVANKVIDQVTETIGQNTEALGEIKETVDVIKEAIKQISGMTLEDVEGKPVEGEVIPAKRKRKAGMAEEETMQDLRDALAGSEERLERLQDVGRDEDVETIEEYEAEIEAYKKDIKDLKEELKEVGATLPRKEGEGPPIISQMVEEEEKFLASNEVNLVDVMNADGNYVNIPVVSQMVEPEVEGVEEYKRQAGWHQNAFTSFASFMWSKPVETIRRYRYASPTMAKLADMIQRDISETKRVIKGGLDYIQRKGMALGQFRVALQATLDNMTGRTGVVSKAVNDAVALYLIQGTPIKDPKVAKAAQEMKNILESIYTWSTELGSKTTKGFSLRPLDGGLLPRVWNIEELATTNGRKKFIKLLATIGVVDNLDSENEFEQTAATDAYNIALNSGGFISGDFTTTAYNQKSKKRRKFQVELFEKIEKGISRAKLGTLLVNDIQAALPRFVDKAIEKTLYAELFGHYDEVLWDMKAQIEKEIREYNQLDSTKRPVKSELAMQDINDMMDIIRHRYKMQSTWFNTRRYVQWFTNFTTVTLMPFVSLASMPEFFTPLMLGSKNPVGFVNDFRSVSWYSALRAMNGMSKLFRGKQLDAMLYPKGKAARRAMFLKALGIIDIKSQGEAAAMRYIGPSFIRTGIAAQGPGAKLGIKALYKLYGLGDVATGRFRARQVRSLMNMDTYFELVLLTSLTQMQQQMAANNLRRYTISLLKSISKGKGNTLQDMKILKDFGLTREEINEAVRWYKAGHREFYDVPTEFKWDPSGMTLRFVDQVITRPNEATASKAFRHPGFAPLLIFKSFMTTFGNTFMVAMRDRVRFAEGEGTAKTYQQAKMAAGYLATMGAMYGMVMFAQSIRHMLQYDDDDDDYMEDVPEWKKFVALLNRTGLLTAPGSQLVDIFLPYKYGWWQKGGERAQDVILGPAYGQVEEILNLITDLANKGEVDLEKFLGRIAPISKYEMFRDIVGAPSYYEKD